MKPFFLLLFLNLSIAYSGFSQSNVLKPFTNYGSCYQGLKSSTTGKIVWKAELESLRQIWDGNYWKHPRSYFWLAEKNGSFGIINAKGELLIPFSYKRIAVFSDAIVAEGENAAYLFSLSGEEKLKMEGYSWIHPSEVGYQVERNDKVGFTGFRMNEILPAEYDKIYFCQIVERREGIRELSSNRFLTVEKGEEKAIFDLTQNKWVVPWTSDYIYANWVTSCKESDAIFHLSNSDRPGSRIFNSSGNEALVYSNPRYSRFELTSLDSCGTQSHQLAYLESDHRMKVINLKSGEYSAEHAEIYPLKGYSIYFDKNRWGIISPDFQELKRFSYPKYEIYTYEGMENVPLYSIAEERFSALFKHEYHELIDSVLITRTEIKPSGKNKRELEQFGLVNFRTGKKIRTKYHEIIRRNLGTQTVFWAYHYNNPHDAYYSKVIGHLDIYDSDLNLVGQLKNIDDAHFDSYERKTFNAIVERDDLKGVVDPFGKIILPIEYDVCNLGYLYSSADKIPYYHCAKRVDPENRNINRYGLFTVKGKELIPFGFKSISIDNNLIFASHDRNNHDIFTFDGKVFMSNANTYINARELTEDGQCIGKTYADKKLHTYFVKGDQLYHSFKGSLELYDSKSFNFSQNYCYLFEWVLIDQNAKVITTEPEGISRRRKYYSNDFVTNCSTFFEEYPIPKKEVKRRTPSPKIEAAPTYQWKPGPSSNLTE